MSDLPGHHNLTDGVLQEGDVIVGMTHRWTVMQHSKLIGQPVARQIADGGLVFRPDQAPSRSEGKRDPLFVAAEEALDSVNRTLVRQAAEIKALEEKLALSMEFVQACAECKFSSSDESDPADVMSQTAQAVLEKFGVPYRTDYDTMPNYGRDPRFRAGNRRQLLRGWDDPDPVITEQLLRGNEPIGTGLSAV